VQQELEQREREQERRQRRCRRCEQQQHRRRLLLLLLLGSPLLQAPSPPLAELTTGAGAQQPLSLAPLSPAAHAGGTGITLARFENSEKRKKKKRREEARAESESVSSSKTEE
jgi:hypothetical protein